MKIVIFFVCLVAAFAVKTNVQNTLASHDRLMAKLAEIPQTPLGRMLSQLVEVHTQIGGPVEELMIAVDEFLAELAAKRKKEMQTYEMLRGEYLDTLQALEAQISRAKLDIATAINKLEMVLKPRVEHLKEDLENMETSMAENRETFQEEVAEREKKHQHYLKNKKEFERAIAAIDECLQIVGAMQSRKEMVSFVEVNKAKRSIQNLKKTVIGQDNQYAPLITALLSLGEDFQNQDVLETILKLLDECKQQVVQALADQTATENKEAKDWEIRSTFLTQEYNKFIERKQEAEAIIKETLEKIEFETRFKQNREGDLADLNEELKQENTEFMKQTDIHNRLIQRIDNDTNLTLKAKDVILEHADNINKFADEKRAAIEWSDKPKLWD